MFHRFFWVVSPFVCLDIRDSMQGRWVSILQPSLMVKRVIVFTWHFSYVRNNCNILDDFLFLNYLARNYLFYRGWVGHFLNHHLRFLCESFCDKDKFSMFDLAASTLINFNDDRIVIWEGGRGEGCWGRADWNGKGERRTQRFWTFWSRACWVCNKNTSPTAPLV